MRFGAISRRYSSASISSPAAPNNKHIVPKLRTATATICTGSCNATTTTRETQLLFNNRPIIGRLIPATTTTTKLQQIHTTLFQRPTTSSTSIHAFSTKADDGNDKEEHQEEPTSSTTTDADDTKIDDNDEKREKEKDEKLFRETMERLNSESSTTKKTTDPSKDDDLLSTLSSTLQTFSSSISETWDELLNSSKPKDINKKMSDIHRSMPGSTTDDDHEAAEKYKGSTAVMVIDEDDVTMNAFERIQKRLSEAPIIQDVLRKSEEIYETSGAARATEKLSHIKEDAQETWETSQNPWIYRASSVYETLTAESEYGATERELRVLDPTFSLESWKNDVVEVTLPNLMQLFLEGRIKELQPTLGESVYNRMAAESRVRKKEGVYVDTNVLSIMNSDIVSCNPDYVNRGSPIIVLHYMCQQINCVRKKKTGEIVEGGEDDIKAYSYVVAFQREYDEEKGELNWKVVDFMVNGAIAYL